MRDTIVFGERSGEVADELLGMDFDLHPDGMATVSGPMRLEGPLWRALLRAEAELLLADADATAAGTYTARTQDKRRADAFVLVAEQLGEAAKRRTNQDATGHDPRGRRASDKRRRSA